MADNKEGFSFFKKKDSTAPSSVEKKDVSKRWMMVGGGAIATAIIVSSMSGQKPPENQNNKKQEERFVEVTPQVTAERTWQASALKDINELKKNVEDSKNKQTLLEKQLEEEKRNNQQLREEISKKKPESSSNAPVIPPSNMPSNIVAPPIPKDGLKDVNMPSNVPSNIPEPKDAPKQSNKPIDINVSKAIDSNNENKPQSGDKKSYNYDGSSGGGIEVIEAPPLKKKVSALEKANAKATMTKNEYAGYIPLGAAIPVTLINGLSAGTSSATQAQPQPVFMRVQNYAELPGAAKYNLDGCFIMASAFGDLSSERVYVRSAKLSCIDKNKKLILVSDLNGVAMDNDSSLGLRGEVENRNGSRLAKAMLAGFAQGLAGAFGQAQSTVMTGVNGTVSTITGEDALKQSGLQGINNATNQLAQFYLKEAQSIFPVISVASGRTATIMLTAGSQLEWGKYDSQYTTKVTPVNN